MLGKALSIGPLLGIVYLALIMWWVSGYTPIGLIETVTDTIVQPLQQVAETLK